MLGKAVLVVLQTLLFLLLFVMGSFLPALTSVPLWQTVTAPGRVFVWDGLVLAVGVYLLLLAAAAARRRLRGPGALTTLAFVLALALGFAMKVGFKST